MTDTRSDRGYAVLGTPRSGSNHLCQLLTSTGVLGKPTEYLNPRVELEKFRDYPNPHHDIWEKIRNVSRSDNGVYALKAFFDQLGRFDPRDVHRNILTLPIVFITRHDKLGQAISLAKATQTFQWHSNNFNISKPPEYDVESIDWCLNHVLHNEISFLSIFATNGIVPFHVAYEDLIRTPDTIVDAVAGIMGIDALPSQPQSSFAIQRNEINEEWRARYVADRGDVNSLHAFAVHSRWAQLGRRLTPVIDRLRPLKRWLPIS